MKNECGFNELKDRLDGISTRTLTDRLRLLEKAKIVKRVVKTESPLRVNYSLTNFGKEEVVLFVPIILNYILAPRYKKKFPNINEIQESVKDIVNLDNKEDFSEIRSSKTKEKIIE